MSEPKIFFTITRSEEFTGATVIIDGTPYPISKDHPNYDEVAEYLQHAEEPLDADYLVALINPVTAVSTDLIRLSDRFTLGGNTLYFDGDGVHSSLAEHIVRVFKESTGEEREAGFTSYIAFAEKLFTNPNPESIEHLYDFATHHKLTITEDGDLLLYKSTNLDGTSTYAGAGIVTTPDGVVTEYKSDYLPNAVGNVVEIPRSLVDTNRHASCSTGLHVGAFNYASSYSKRLFNVKVNPRDVVSVPHNSSAAKIRVARYEIIGENVKKAETTTPSVKVKAVSTPVADTSLSAEDRAKVDEFKAAIPGIIKGGWTKKLVTYANKKVTRGQRDNFKLAIAELGLE